MMIVAVVVVAVAVRGGRGGRQEEEEEAAGGEEELQRGTMSGRGVEDGKGRVLKAGKLVINREPQCSYKMRRKSENVLPFVKIIWDLSQ